MKATNEDIQIFGKLVNVSTEGVVADASQIWSEKNKASIEDVVKNIDNKIQEFKHDPEFNKATFHGDVVFEGDATVEGNQTVRGNQDVNGNQEVRGTLDAYEKITAHALPVGIQVDHKITCNDLSVAGTFSAFKLDTNNLTVHNTIKSEGDLRVDGNTIVNNFTINGSVSDATKQTLLPNGTEGQVLVYKNGKWVAGDLGTLIKNNSDITNYIQNMINKSIQQTVNSQEMDNRIEQVVNKYWVKNGETLTTAEGVNNVNAKHFYKDSTE